MFTNLVVIVQLGFAAVGTPTCSSLTSVTTVKDGFIVRYKHDKSIKANNRDDWRDYVPSELTFSKK
jgi:hypothetical protein